MILLRGTALSRLPFPCCASRSRLQLALTQSASNVDAGAFHRGSPMQEQRVQPRKAKPTSVKHRFLQSVRVRQGEMSKTPV